MTVSSRVGRALAVVAVMVMAAVTVAAPEGASAVRRHASGTQRAKIGVHYATFKNLCSTPKPGHAGCMAIRRVPEGKSDPNAQPYRVQSSFPVGPSGYGLTPGDLATAYGFDPDAAAGASQTVAIVDAYNDPSILADLNVFDATYGLPAETTTSFQVVGQSGTASLPVDDRSGWSGEEALDVETVRGVCHLCRILLVETNTSRDIDLQAGVNTAVALGATEVSNSYGGPEGGGHPTKAELRAVAAAYTHPGVVMTAASGDDGWFTWDKINDGPGNKSAESPNLPASLPQVIAVGGTALNLNFDGSRRSETVWNENGPADRIGLSSGFSQGATGGGCSTLFSAASWQAAVANYSRTGCGTARLASDVAADADPNTGYDVYTSFNCGRACGRTFPVWQPIGGTSLSAPIIAAMYALAGGAPGVPAPVQTLYTAAATSPLSFYDVTSGGNGFCSGLAPAACERATKRLTKGTERNPNNLALVVKHRGKKHEYRLGRLDCGFPKGKKSGKPPKHLNPLTSNTQCYAAPGYDGPSGLGTPNGLGGFRTTG